MPDGSPHAREARSPELGAGVSGEHEVTRSVRLPDRREGRTRDVDGGRADQRARVFLGTQTPGHLGHRRDHPLVVARHTRLRTLVAHDRLDGEADDEGDSGPQRRAAPVARRVAVRVAEEERENEHGRADGDAECHLLSPQIERDPDHGEQRERRVAGDGAVVCLAHECHDHEVGKRRDDVGPARQSRPRHEQPGRGDDGGQHARDPHVRPVVRPRRQRCRQQGEQSDRDERREPPCDLRLEMLLPVNHPLPDRPREPVP